LNFVAVLICCLNSVAVLVDVMLYAIDLTVYIVIEPVVTLCINGSARSMLFVVAIVTFYDLTRLLADLDIETMSVFRFFLKLPDTDEILVIL
jgi:hypothetical protein